MAPIRPSHFTISLKHYNKSLHITMFVPGGEVTTANMPYVSEILMKELPSILRSTCFNENNIPFSEEVLSTELGHLFEHIFLEYLCIAKISIGSTDAIFSGITNWDWNKDPYGTFRIILDIDPQDMLCVSPALSRTIRLMEKILVYKPLFSSYHPRLA